MSSASKSFVASGQARLKFFAARELNKKVAMMPTVGEAMLLKAEEAAEVAKKLAPVDTGAYRDGIEASAENIEGMRGARVKATDWKSALVEFGTALWPAHATLRRAAESVGLKVVARRG